MKCFKRLLSAGLALAMTLTLAACGTTSGENAGRDTASSEPVRIATKPMTEQYILGEMLGLLIEQAGYDVEITKGVGGGTSNIQPAMEAGEFDLYPEYTSSGWVLVLDHQAEGVDDEEMFAQLQQEYQENFDMTWVGMYGFNNTFTVAVRGDIAEQYGLEDTSDLAAVAGELTFGGNPDYIEREDGFGALCETYGLEFGDVVDIDIGLKYQALASGDIDVTNAFTTDAQLANPDTDLVTLTDDKQAGELLLLHRGAAGRPGEIPRPGGRAAADGRHSHRSGDGLPELPGGGGGPGRAGRSPGLPDPEGPAGGVTWRSPSSGLKESPSPMGSSRS